MVTPPVSPPKTPEPPQIPSSARRMRPSRRQIKNAESQRPDIHWSAPVKSRKRKVSFADRPTVRSMTDWFYADKTPKRGRYKSPSRRSHTIKNSQFQDIDVQIESESVSLNTQNHAGQQLLPTMDDSDSPVLKTMGSLNVPGREKMRQFLSRQFSLDAVPMYSMYFEQSPTQDQPKRRSCVSKKKKRRLHKADQ